MAQDLADPGRAPTAGGAGAGESRIRLLPAEGRTPLNGRMPTPRALRWRSDRESEGEQRAVSVFFAPRAYVRVCAHAGSDLDNEVGGALVGRWRADSSTGRQYVVVEAAIRAQHTRHGSAFLTFTTESLVALHDEMERRYPTKELVGWYHTHPRMGVFLSGYDVWLHQHFFPEPWQVALVIEPYTRLGGFFIREVDGRLNPHRYVGFYELVPRGSSSLVYWQNLEPELKVEQVEGGMQS